MEPKASSSRLKEPGTCPYPKPDQSSSHHPIRFLLRSVLLVSSHQSPVCSEWALSLRFPHQALYAPFLAPIHATFHTHLIIFDLVSQVIFREEFHEVNLLCCFLSPLYSFPSYANIFLSTIFPNTFSLLSFLTVRGEGSQQNKTG